MGIDLVCGMIVDEKAPPAKTSHQGTDYYFCAVYCKEAFEKEPQRFIEGVKKWGEAVDPVCGMNIEIPHAAAMSVYQGQFVYFCNVSCKEKFDVSPEKLLRREKEVIGRAIDPVCKMEVDAKKASAKLRHMGNTYYFFAPACKRAFDEDHAKYTGTGRYEMAGHDSHKM